MHNGSRYFSSGVVVIVVFTLLVMTTSCNKKEKQQSGPPPAPVTVGVVSQKAVPLQIRVIGNVEASSTVAIKAQIGGVLTKVHFSEGKDVNRGDVLFTIDPRPYEAALKQAEANLARSRAQLDNARAEEKRYAELVRKGYVSQTQYEQVRTNAEALDATSQADRAVVENARLNLQYCTIRAPFGGRTGSLIVNEGNLIKANADTAMVTINQIRPVHVGFSVPEKDLPEIKKYMAKGALGVEAYLPQDEVNAIRGRLAFIENTVDAATGTIRLKGFFDNGDLRLWPGQFVNVVLTLSVQKDAVVVETRAVQTGQKGSFVFVLKEDSTVDARPVTAGRTFGSDSVIDSGLKPGEKVITDGQLRLMPGIKVEIKTEKQSAKGEESKEQSGKDKVEAKEKVKEEVESKTGTKEKVKAEGKGKAK